MTSIALLFVAEFSVIFQEFDWFIKCRSHVLHRYRVFMRVHLTRTSNESRARSPWQRTPGQQTNAARWKLARGGREHVVAFKW